MRTGLTDGQAEYCRHRIAGKSKAESYALAYPKFRAKHVHARDSAGRRVEAVPHVKAVIDAGRRQRLERAVEDGVVEAVDLMRELAKIGFSNIADYASFDDGMVRLHNSEGISQEKLAAVESVSTNKYGVAIKLHGKTQALTKLGEMIGVFERGANAANALDVAAAIEEAWKHET